MGSGRPTDSSFRDNPAAIAKHLSAAFKTNDLNTVLIAINEVMRAQNVLVLSKEAGLHRVTFIKASAVRPTRNWAVF